MKVKKERDQRCTLGKDRRYKTLPLSQGYKSQWTDAFQVHQGSAAVQLQKREINRNCTHPRSLTRAGNPASWAWAAGEFGDLGRFKQTWCSSAAPPASAAPGGMGVCPGLWRAGRRTGGSTSALGC